MAGSNGGAAATTRSSSAAATTAWSAPRTSPAAGCARSSSSAATSSVAPRSPPSSRPARACPRWPTPSAGCARRSGATSTSRATACASCRRTSGPSRPRPTARPSRCGPTSARPPPGSANARRTTASGYVEFDRQVRSLGRFLAELAARTPPDIEAPGLGDALLGLTLGRRFRGLGRHDGRTVLRVLPMAVADFVAEAFETDALQAALAWRGVAYTAMGPWSASTAAVLLGDSAGNDGGAAGPTVYRRGRAGRADRRAGRCGARRRRRDPDGRRGCRDPLARRPGDRRRPGGWRGDRGAAVVSASIRSGRCRPGGPRGARADAGLARGQHPHARDGREGQPRAVGPADVPCGARRRRAPPARPDRRGAGIDAIERAFDAAKYGGLTERPVLEATIPSLADPSLVAAGAGRDARHERDRPVRAVRACARARGTSAATSSATRSSPRSTRWPPACRRWSRPARS